MKTIFWTILTAACLASSSPAGAEDGVFTPLPGDGTTTEWCDIASSGDLDEDGRASAETLRHRIEIYNDQDRCRFYLFFLYRNKTIRLEKPLVLKKRLHDRDPSPDKQVLTGTYVSGYGPGGLTDRLGIVIDALKVTADPDACGVVVEGGFSAKQQIHGLTIQVRDEGRAICDEDGQDLLRAVSPNCDGGKTGRDCDFGDVNVLVEAYPGDGPTTGNDDDDGDGVTDKKDLCPGDPMTGGETANYGCPNTKCVVFRSLFLRTPISPLATLRSASTITFRPSASLVARINPRLFFPLKPVVRDKTGIDTDGDGIDDACDLHDDTPVPCDGMDEDGDGVCDAADNCPAVANQDQDDRDGDDDGDVCDDDADGDGLPNSDDPNPLDSDGDEDGITDALEGTLGTDPKSADTDGDGTPDGLDCRPADPAAHDCVPPALETPPAETPPAPEPTPPAPAESPEPAAVAPQSCGLQLVAPDPSGGMLPFWQMSLASLLLIALKRRKKRP